MEDLLHESRRFTNAPEPRSILPVAFTLVLLRGGAN
jgi:hypothetical protein